MRFFNIPSRSFVEQRVADIRAEGIAIGVAKANRLWQEWNRRRVEAEAEGRRFDEPPPA